MIAEAAGATDFNPPLSDSHRHRFLEQSYDFRDAQLVARSVAERDDDV